MKSSFGLYQNAVDVDLTGFWRIVPSSFRSGKDVSYKGAFMKYMCLLVSFFIVCLSVFSCEKSTQEEFRGKPFSVWATSDSHIHTDLKYGYESIAEAVRQSEFGGEGGGPSFKWDIMLHLGDLKGSSADGQGLPTDENGIEVVRQFTSAKKHRREQIYNILGNHDASPGQWWFRKWVDPTGESIGYSRVHAERRPFPVEGTWERYAFYAGNILFLMMGDRNDPEPPVGRGSKIR